MIKGVGVEKVTTISRMRISRSMLEESIGSLSPRRVSSTGGNVPPATLAARTSSFFDAIKRELSHGATHPRRDRRPLPTEIGFVSQCMTMSLQGDESYLRRQR